MVDKGSQAMGPNKLPSWQISAAACMVWSKVFLKGSWVCFSVTALKNCLALLGNFNVLYRC